MFHRIQLTLGALALSSTFLISKPAAATAATISNGEISYVAAFAPTLGGPGVPYLGTMKLALTGGTVTGTYHGISARPDALDDRITNVTGSISGKHVFFYVGNVLSFTGEINDEGTLSGTATMNGRLYDFVAEQGSPHGH